MTNPILDEAKEYPFARLLKVKARRVAEGHRVLDFGMGDPRDPTPAFLRETLARSVPETSSYPTVRGSLALPYALMVIWPAMRLIDRSVFQAATLEGAGSWQQFWQISLPLVRPATAVALLVSVILSIGELSSTVMVAPPGLQPLSLRIFTLAHFGVENYLAGICVVYQLVVLGGAVALAMALRLARRASRRSVA